MGKYIEDSDGKTYEEKEHLFGGKYYKDSDGKTYEEKERLFGGKYYEDSDGKTYEEKEHLFGGKYYKDSDGKTYEEKERLFGGGGGDESGLGGQGVVVACLMGIAILLGMIVAGINYLDRKTEDLIHKVYPAYETSSARVIRQKQELRPMQERWEQFISNSDQWLKVPESTLFLPGQIIFISSERGNREIFLVDPDSGKRPVNLTERFAGDIVAAAPSLDGKQIAFIANQKGESGIYVMNSDGAKIIPITTTVDGLTYTELVWLSPSRILTTQQNHPYVKTIWEVEIDYRGRTPAQSAMIIPSYEEYNGKWVKEGRKEHFYSCDNPAISPDDKRRIIYVKKEYRGLGTLEFPCKAQIIVRDLRTIPARDSIIGGFGVALSPQAWCPSGDKIVGHFSKFSKDLIGIVELSSSRIHWLDITGRNPAWSLAPGGKAKRIDSGTAYKSSTAWSSGRKQANLTVPGRNPAWSTDGKWIAFDHEGTIYAVEVASGNVRKIVGPRFLGKSGTNPLWVQLSSRKGEARVSP